tara:strand:+ start:110 stop:1054 length:945 start_codon:yes stop_codon:yes gene_type:complete
MYKKLILIALVGFFSSYQTGKSDHHNEEKIKQSDHIPGTWTRSWISPEGKSTSMTKVIKAMKKPNQFVETISSTNEKGEITSKWELRFKIESIAGNMLKFQGIQNRGMDLKTSKWNDWKDNNFQYLFQVDEFFWNEVMQDLENSTKRRFSRVMTSNKKFSYKDLAKRKLSILKPTLGNWEGSVEQVEVKAYGLPAHTQNIKHPVKFNKDETIMVLHWTSEEIDVIGTISYDALNGHLVKNYHSSTGAQMTGKLISWNDNKFLWERTGNTPNGFLYEKCLVDVSKPGIFRHKIMDRTLKGVPQPEEPEIILKKVN